MDIVFTGHDHLCAHIEKNDEPGLHYVIVGNSGKSLYECGAEPLDAEAFDVTCYDADFGAVKGTWTGDVLNIEFFAVSDILLPEDHFTLRKPGP